MKINLNDFTETLPYTSELFGVYQPLLGWRSRLISRRVARGRQSGMHQMAQSALSWVKAPDAGLSDTRLVPLTETLKQEVAPAIDSCIARRVALLVAEATPPINWKALLEEGRLTELLRSCANDIREYLAGNKPGVNEYVLPYLDRATRPVGRETAPPSAGALFQRERKVAGYLNWLSLRYPAVLDNNYFSMAKPSASEIISWLDPYTGFGQKKLEAVLSPIGIIHLFRQYFFEFKSFLGPAVSHVWVSPGTTVELFEVSTRKKIIERTLETASESTLRSESQSTNQDELSDAVREENKSDTRFGFSAEARTSVPFFQASANSSLNLDNARNTSRDTTHKNMRQQSEKLSSEIKRSFKSTFRTSTELQDTSSKRYVIDNKTEKLINYELRRKMRLVGVQVQDLSTQLCWQVYVDEPGRELGVAELVHIAEPADLANMPMPEGPAQPERKTVELSVQFAYENTPDSEGDEKDVVFYDGDDQEGGLNNNDKIVWKRNFNVEPPAPGYTLEDQFDWMTSHTEVCVAELKRVNSTGTFEVALRQVNFNDQNSIPLKVTTYWNPPPTPAEVQQAYNDKMAEYAEDKKRKAKEAYVTAARERIKQASQIQGRPSEDLREEERVVVYRRLISQLMKAGDGANRHITAELIRSLFDVEKMLYFVAPEWWAPRQHESHQALGGSELTDEYRVSWGGGDANREDNYFITDESSPAPFGASLGWLLQLDGDSMRNAFLNSPWVKAVIPIRLGKEKEALAWLQQAHVEGSDGLDALYDAPKEELEKIKPGGQGVTIQDALDYLAEQVATWHKKAGEAGPDPIDPSRSVLPTELVFEHGFYPLQGSFKADQDPLKVFSQWVEILPTDQLVAVEYDPADHL